MAMRKPGPTLAVMIGLPSPLAHESEHDEDDLDREKDDGGDNENDIASEIVVAIVRALHERGPGAVRTIRLLTQSLEEMCDAATSRDDRGVEEAAGDAHKMLCDLLYR